MMFILQTLKKDIYRLKLFITFWGMILFFSSCQSLSTNNETIEGNGNIVSKECKISDYSQLELRGKIDVVYEPKKNFPPYMRIEADENLLKYIKMDKSRKKITIYSSKNILPTKYIIYTNSSSLAEIKTSGACSVSLENGNGSNAFSIISSGASKINAKKLSCQNIDINTSGSVIIRLSGISDFCKIRTSGSGSIDLTDVKCKNAQINASGSGDIKVNTSDNLNVGISGAGKVSYKGNPSISKSISGNGEIIKID